jgi:hypothetical protein
MTPIQALHPFRIGSDRYGCNDLDWIFLVQPAMVALPRFAAEDALNWPAKAT